MFEEFKPNWYEVKTSVENDWLNEKLENHNYGIYYAVLFVGDAETYLWQTKTPPVVGEKYYGHVAKAKSGKSMRFSLDKVPENSAAPAEANSKQASYVESPEKQNSINRSVALNNAVLSAVALGLETPDQVTDVADRFYLWLTDVKDPFVKDEPELTQEDM